MQKQQRLKAVAVSEGKQILPIQGFSEQIAQSARLIRRQFHSCDSQQECQFRRIIHGSGQSNTSSNNSRATRFGMGAFRDKKTAVIGCVIALRLAVAMRSSAALADPQSASNDGSDTP